MLSDSLRLSRAPLHPAIRVVDLSRDRDTISLYNNLAKETGMTYAKLGRSNLTVSRICLGTMHFGPRASEKEAFRIMDGAVEAGINLFDTANAYGGNAGPGKTEEIIGNWFAQGGGRRDKVVLATKVYAAMGNATGPNEEPGISAYKVRRQVADSLRRLRTDHIDLYQVHHIDRRITGEEFWGTFERLVDKGDVGYVGTSNFPGWGLAKFQMMAAQRGFLGIVSEQAQYNLLNRIPELEVIPAAREFGIGILSYMPLAGGLLSGKRKSEPGSRTSVVEGEYRMKVEDNPQLGSFSELCRKIGEDERAVAIAWTLANPATVSSIVGMRSADNLEGVLRAAELKLDDETMRRLDEIFDVNRGRPLHKGEAPQAWAW
jgi:aryl-alcohol dehydrogenase-like predicted oxidoreductase